ncbi:helix-turn-helix transcriptional regulator [Streptomyces orinoci]|uniref:LuxR C-terminal-related transcriptional regulator n=1 Tax=Streptomyces orinoci TaxID=67339 RepID=A0ABV3JRX0_STRON|nr:LuxR C-terminal-related transcriptional regulator [Streptomyces orinoci]
MLNGEDNYIWRNHFLVLLDRVPTPIAVCEQDGEITIANLAMAVEWGTVPGRLRGRRLQEFFRPRSVAQLDRLADALRLGRRSRYAIEVCWPPAGDGPQRSGEFLIDLVDEPSRGSPVLLAVLRTREPDPPLPGAEVSPVEERILALVASGATTAAVGKAVGLTVDGVNYHLTRLSRRWRVRNRTALVAKAYVLGVLAPDQWPPRTGGGV